MQRPILLPSSILGCILALAAPVLGQSTSTFTTFDVPAAGTGALQGTAVTGIDAAGDVAGTYIDAIGVYHGFIRAANGTITTFDVPGSVTTKGNGTFVSAMDIAGDVAGHYTVSQYGQTYGFVRMANGVITTFNDSASVGSTVAIGINSLGTVTGETYAVSGFNNAPGFIGADNGAITTFAVPVPGQAASDNYPTVGIAINTAGVIAGRYSVYGSNNSTGPLSHGVIRAANGTITTFDPANVSTSVGSNSFNDYIGTLPTSIDTAGDIAGSYTDTNGARHGFVRLASGAITSFDPPGTDSSPCPPGNTVAICGSGGSAINDAGQIVGVYMDTDNVGHGFLRAANGSITSFDVPGAGTGSYEGTAAFAINATGTVAGIYLDANSVIHGFVGTLSPTASTTTLTPAPIPNPSIYGQPVTLSATVSGSGSTPANGENVTFMSGATTLGTALLSSGAASFTTTDLAVGANSITAVYAGDTSFAGSTSTAIIENVGKANSSTTLTASPNPSVSTQAVTLTAVVSGQLGGTTTGSVTFNDGATSLGTASLSGNTASLTTTALPAGADSIAAVYSGDGNFVASTSSAVNQVVTDFSVAASPATLTVAAGSSGTTTITVTPQNGFNSAVTFSCSSGLPAGASCSFSPSSVTPSGAAVSTTLTISATTTASALHRDGRPLFPAAAVATLLCCFGWKQRRRLPMLLLLAVSVAGVSLLNGCSSGSSSGGTGSGGTGSQSSTSTVTVTAASGSDQHTTTFSITVN